MNENLGNRLKFFWIIFYSNRPIFIYFS